MKCVIAQSKGRVEGTTSIGGNCDIYLVGILHPIAFLEVDPAQFMNGFQTMRQWVSESPKVPRLPKPREPEINCVRIP
jgi:hypothetical protein